MRGDANALCVGALIAALVKRCTRWYRRDWLSTIYAGEGLVRARLSVESSIRFMTLRLVCLLLLFASERGLAADQYDVILRHGRIVDGTGNPPFTPISR